MISASSEYDATRELLARGDACAQASYRLSSGLPWGGNLKGVREMNFAFASCSAVATLDLRGFDPSALTNLTYAFASCSALTTILTDSTWTLPSSGLSGSQCFYSSKLLVGGNGTAWSSSNVSYKYCVIVGAGSPGYLTAA